MLRDLKDNVQGMVDITIVLAVGIVFAALMVIAYIIWELDGQLLTEGAPSSTTTTQYNMTYNSIRNVTDGFDDAVNLILVAITVFILAIAIAALLMLRGQRQ